MTISSRVIIMELTIKAKYEKGVFRPVTPPPINEGEVVTLVVTKEDTAKQDVLVLASRVYEGLSEKEINEIEAIALDRSNFM